MSSFRTVHTSESDWDERWLRIAKEVSTWSKDPSTGVGAVAVKDNDDLVKGYNGFPSRIPDRVSWLEDRDTKLDLTIHAEMNIINKAARRGVSLEGATLYVHGLPVCKDCMKALLNAGISRFVIDVPRWRDDWGASWEASKKILRMARMHECWQIRKEIGPWEHGSLQFGPP